MECPWGVHGVSVGSPCAVRGVCVRCSWCVREVSVGSTWEARGVSVGCIGRVREAAHGQPMRCALGVHGVSMVRPRFYP